MLFVCKGTKCQVPLPLWGELGKRGCMHMNKKCINKVPPHHCAPMHSELLQPDISFTSRHKQVCPYHCGHITDPALCHNST